LPSTQSYNSNSMGISSAQVDLPPGPSVFFTLSLRRLRRRINYPARDLRRQRIKPLSRTGNWSRNAHINLSSVSFSLFWKAFCWGFSPGIWLFYSAYKLTNSVNAGCHLIDELASEFCGGLRLATFFILLGLFLVMG